ncbi:MULTISPECIES: TIGR03364 family FAD-dependent oxidoreductase [unclassified Gordonia (in: high G+C Gram-positive bacteria)]|uniref:TIGR03364 family FAD-dependent oxidoreductase n=1 Tax=Gordonia TaxID=2053 RepID=UPI0010F45193|nr:MULTISPECIES: TIGR03364 family FAD-dependent oxidoreductase [unclassified Gordonia (in: high G+C Gram-positive bacteria)]MDT0222570.1 TIGR03364 family FAD-dependent oxidoreductase [Gordonia sp. AC31]
MRVIIVGAGIIGTAHAWMAVERGHEVIHLDRELGARGATVRNFGLVWVSGRSAPELEIALRSRILWEQIGTQVPKVGFRANGSITLLRTEAELAVAEEVLARDDAQRQGFSLLRRIEVAEKNPALQGNYLAGLYCASDAAVESRQAMPALRFRLERSGRYTFVPGVEARAITGTSVRDDTGAVHAGDCVVLCPGATHRGLLREIFGELPVRRVRLQMMQTAPLGQRLTTSIADGDSLRYYPGFAGPALEELRRTEPQRPVAADHGMQLLCVQRLHGGLTIGDTHEYVEPFTFDVEEDPYAHLVEVTEGLLGRPLPKIQRRWAGVYSQCTEPHRIVCRESIGDGVWAVTGPGGRGMTLGPAIAEESAELMGW